MGNCHRDGYKVTHEQLSGEFDLDEPAALSLVQQLQQPGAGGPSLRPPPWPEQAQAGSDNWIADYLLWSPSDKSLGNQVLGATVEPGNILGNLGKSGGHQPDRCQRQCSASNGASAHTCRRRQSEGFARGPSTSSWRSTTPTRTRGPVPGRDCGFEGCRCSGQGHRGY